MDAMKDHINTYAMLIGLALLLVTILVLASEGSKADGPLLIGIAGSVSTIVGAIAGKQLSAATGNAPPQIPQLPQLPQTPATPPVVVVATPPVPDAAPAA